jgi:hypothetical protein
LNADLGVECKIEKNKWGCNNLFELAAYGKVNLNDAEEIQWQLMKELSKYNKRPVLLIFDDHQELWRDKEGMNNPASSSYFGNFSAFNQGVIKINFVE